MHASFEPLAPLARQHTHIPLLTQPPEPMLAHHALPSQRVLIRTVPQTTLALEKVLADGNLGRFSEDDVEGEDVGLEVECERWIDNVEICHGSVLVLRFGRRFNLF